MTSELTPQQAAQGALRAGLALGDDRHERVAATANHIHSVIATLRELDFADTPPAVSYRAGQENADAAL
ncbi:hypothetical protein SAMN06272771_0619 [Streptomyces sp. Ag82_O1-12]|uniref:hypothetical protein n=1 Tax=unclassified Streptomyces TaxID=2593676 RepID=UPI000BC8DDF6|nr:MULTISPECIES: hypothetical protein [unclassified Streptomyces]SMQ14325.1 hypothetical protein SAMN06272771_0619 [Streptomyces sp. Ag82_O1-12]SOD43351.1 hypothetical protein SAMN06272727_0608 [Streptomyces sp. Ag82_G6-1]